MTLLPARANPSAVGPRMHASILIDASTSMAKIQRTVETSFNDYLDTLREQPAEVRASVGTFANQFKAIAVGVPLMQVPYLTRETYQPNGNTLLYDSLARAILMLDGQLAERDRALVVIVTDGQDNISSEFTEDEIADMVRLRVATGRWTFIFIGPDKSVGVRLGIDNLMRLGSGADGFASAMAQLAETTTQLLLTGRK